MAKKFIITEDEKNNIKKLYNIVEQPSDDIDDNLLGAFLSVFFPKVEDVITPSETKSPESSSLSKISDKGSQLLNNQVFKDRIESLSSKLGINKECIIKIMNFESKLDPSIKNSIGCVGLIQFCPDSKGGSTKTINGKQYDLSQLRDDLSLQMDAIENFWLTGKKQGRINECSDLHLYNFFPVAAGKSDDYVLQTNTISAERIANQNPVFNRILGRERNTPLTVGDIKDFQRQVGIS